MSGHHGYAATAAASSANIIFGQHWTWDTVCSGPKPSQNDRVIEFVCRARRHKRSLSISKPLFPTGLRFIRSNPGGKEKSLAGARFCHFAMGL
jgi:hypothetical protein